MIHQGNRGLIAYRLGKKQLLVSSLNRQTPGAFPVSGMNRIDSGRIQCLQRIKNMLKFFIGIRILLPVTGHIIKRVRHRKRFPVGIHQFLELTAIQTLGIIAESVIHRIPHYRCRMPKAFPFQEFQAGLGTGQIDGRKMICHCPVYFLRAVQRAEPISCFYMADGDMQFYRSQSRSQASGQSSGQASGQSSGQASGQSSSQARSQMAQSGLHRADRSRTAAVSQKIEALASLHRDLNSVTAGIDALYEQYPLLNSWISLDQYQRGAFQAEEHLQAARRLYNANVSLYNQTIRTIPWAIVASLCHMEAAGFYEADENKRNFEANFD